MSRERGGLEFNVGFLIGNKRESGLCVYDKVDSDTPFPTDFSYPSIIAQPE